MDGKWRCSEAATLLGISVLSCYVPKARPYIDGVLKTCVKGKIVVWIDCGCTVGRRRRSYGVVDNKWRDGPEGGGQQIYGGGCF